MILTLNKKGLQMILLFCTVLFFACEKEDISPVQSNTSEINNPIDKKAMTNSAQMKKGQENLIAIGFIIGSENEGMRTIIEDELDGLRTSDLIDILQDIVEDKRELSIIQDEIDGVRTADLSEIIDILQNDDNIFSSAFIGIEECEGIRTSELQNGENILIFSLIGEDTSELRTSELQNGENILIFSLIGEDTSEIRTSDLQNEENILIFAIFAIFGEDTGEIRTSESLNGDNILIFAILGEDLGSI